MNLKRIWLFSIVLALLGVIAPAVASEDNAAVYEALFAKLGQPERKYVILETPLDSKEEAARLKNYRFPDNNTNHKSGNFGKISVELLSQEIYMNIFSDKKGLSIAWKEFHERYPYAGALVQISHVGFRNKNREAVVYVNARSAGLAGIWSLWFFRKIGSTWKLKKTVNVGIS